MINANPDNGNRESRYIEKINAIINSIIEIDKISDSEEMRSCLDKLMVSVSELSGAEYIYFFHRSKDGQLFNSTYTWAKEKSEITGDSRTYFVDIDNIPYWYNEFKEYRSVVVNDIETVRDIMPEEYKMLRKEDIASVVAIPLYHDGKLVGFVSLNNITYNIDENFLNVIKLVGSRLNISSVNVKRKQQLDDKIRELEREQIFLEILCQEYTSVYYLDMRTGIGEVLKIDPNANASKFIEGERNNKISFFEMVKVYADHYMDKDYKKKFLSLFDNEFINDTLRTTNRISFRYKSMPNFSGQQYFEVQFVKVKEFENGLGIMVAFRYIDDIILQEKKYSEKLEKALDEIRLSNSIMAAISKIYFSIYRIELENDSYEEIAAEEEIHKMTGKHGTASVKLREICDNIVDEEHRKSVTAFFDLSTMKDRLRDDETVAIEYKAADGNWHLARFIAKQRDSDGEVTHVLYATRIINETKRREESLALIAEQAKRENEAKTDFLSRISHDIRTPMNAICGFTRVAREHIDDRDKVLHGLNQIDVASNYLIQIMDDVLDLSRIEKGKLSVYNNEMSIKADFNQISETIAGPAEGKNIEMNCHMENILHDTVIADSLKLRQIYMNLLSNAVKYTPEGGTVEFLISEEEIEDENKVRLKAMIKDNGMGMSEEYMKEMYNRFSRGVDTRINKVRGTGLGLSVVKEFVDLMDGTIEAESKEGEGTTFYVSFDVEYTDTPTDKPVITEHSHENCVSGMHLLIAEDNDLNYEVARELLKMEGITCDRAENGQICVEMFHNAKSDTYDAILMDMQMPVMDGLQAAKLIRKLGTKGTEIPIIAVTANALDNDREACLSVGMNTHLSKPFDIDQLTSVLSSIVKK